MSKLQLEELPIEINIRNIKSKVIIDKNYMTMKNLILNSYEKIPEHNVPVNVTFLVLDGRGQITIGNNIYDVIKNSIVLCPPNTTMSVSAGKEGLSFINIKTPGIKILK